MMTIVRATFMAEPSHVIFNVKKAGDLFITPGTAS